MPIALQTLVYQVLTQLRRRARDARRRVEDRGALAAMSHRELADLGIGRDQIDRLIAAPELPRRA